MAKHKVTSWGRAVDLLRLDKLQELVDGSLALIDDANGGGETTMSLFQAVRGSKFDGHDNARIDVPRVAM